MISLMITFPAFDPVALSLGPLSIHWYSLAYVFGISFGWYYGALLLKTPHLWNPKTGAPLTPELFGDYVFWLALGIIIGGRLGYVIFYNPLFYLNNPIEIIAFWNGGLKGMSFHGAAFALLLATYIFARKNSVPLMALFDIIGAVSCIGLAFGRLGNFINGELWGRATDVPWAIVFPLDETAQPRHPSQLYEALLEGFLLFGFISLLVWKYKLLARPGKIAAAGAIGYSLMRIFVEFFREPDPQLGFLFGPVTMGMLLSALFFLFGLYFYFYGERKTKT